MSNAAASEDELGRIVETLEIAGVAALAFGSDGRCIASNGPAGHLVGGQAAGCTGQDLETVFGFAEPPGPETLRHAVENETPTRVELLDRRADRRFEATVVPGPAGMLLRIAETTDAWRAEKARREMERRLLSAQAIAEIGSWELDLTTMTMWSTPEGFRIYGLEETPDRTMSLAEVQRIPLPDERPRLDAALHALIATDAPYDVVFRIRRPRDGVEAFVHSQAELTRDPAGRPLRVLGTVRDVTERTRVETERNRLLSAIRQTADVVILQDPEGNLVYVNPAFTAVYGWTAEEVLGKRLDFLSSGCHDAAFWSDRLEAVQAGRTWTGQITNLRRDGDRVLMASTLSPMRDADGRITGYVQVGRDVTEQREAEARATQAQRLESIGRLAGGIAHDFNNLLTAIRGYADLLRVQSEVFDESAHGDIDGIIRGTERASALTRQLLQYSGRERSDPLVVDPAVIDDELLPMLRRLIEASAAIVVDRVAVGARVRIDTVHLEQILVNLVVNARDAMPGGGTIRVSTSTIGHGPGEDGAGLGWCAVSVADEGSGIDEETRARIFEPFFTTKRPGQGTGMGLATVSGLVTLAGGSIEVDSTPGRGTTFTILLPLVDAPLSHAPAVVERVPLGGSETILVVEDDEEVRRFAHRVLAGAGYRVLEAADGDEAIALAAARSGPIHLVVTDMVMPGLGGVEVARRLAEARPGIGCLFTSGYAFGEDATERIPGCRSAFLAKPYSMDTLRGAVRAVLEAGGASARPFAGTSPSGLSRRE